MKDSASDEFFEPDMPPAGDAEYLLDHFWKVGPSVGDSQITQGELRHYQDNNGITLSPWECNTLRQLSIDYLNESHRATKADCPPPYGESRTAMNLRAAELQKKMDLFLS